MLGIEIGSEGEVLLSGRFDAAQVDKARQTFDRLEATCLVDFGGLAYISSAGLGVLLGTQKRLKDRGASLQLVNLNQHIREIFRLSGLDHIFEIR